MRPLHSAFTALLVASTALAGIAIASGCETDDSSTPLPPAVTDATTDHAATDGAGGGGDSASDGATPVESSTDAPAESAADGGTTGD